MKEFLRSAAFKIIAGLLVVCFGMMIAAGSSKGFSGVGESLIGFFVKPFQEISTWVGDGVSGFFSELFAGSKLREENEALQQEINELRSQLTEYDNALRENENYKDYLGLAKENPDWKLVAASVVERDPISAYGEFKINKGSLQGIKERDVVITADGMVGVISQVGWTYSTVETLLDPNLNVGCICSRTGDTGLLAGTMLLAADGLTSLSYIDKTSGIQPGDYIITGGSELFPARLVVGRVQKISSEDGGSGLHAVITPVVDIKRVQEVMVITDFYGKAKEESDLQG